MATRHFRLGEHAGSPLPRLGYYRGVFFSWLRRVQWRSLLLLTALLCSVQLAGAEERSPARAWSQGPLGKQAAKLERAWEKEGHVRRLPPRLLVQGLTHHLILPERLMNPASPGCLTVAVLATTNLSYLLVFDDHEGDPARRAWPVPSAAGAAEITRCGARKPALKSLAIKLRSRAGVFDVVLLSSKHPPTSLSELFSSRNAGPSVASPQIGKRPWLAPLKDRLDARRQKHRTRVPSQTELMAFQADNHGRGSQVLHLPTGCHRLDLLAESNPETPPDLDMRLTTLTTAEPLTRDEDHSGQASLRYCVGRAQRFRVTFSGAQPKEELSLLRATWSIPPGFPAHWGPTARSRLAEAAWSAPELPPLGEAPLHASLGARGVTRMTLPVLPRLCYVALVAHLRGKEVRFALGARVGDSLRQSQSLVTGEGTSLSFCTGNQRSATLEVQALGQGVAWILGLWRVSTPRAIPSKGTTHFDLPRLVH